MYFKQFYDEKLSQTSYLVACQETKEAIVIDPNRNLNQYMDVASDHGFNIKYITETHIHADFASGLRELSDVTNAVCFVSDEGGTDWKYQNLPNKTQLIKHGDIFHLGNVVFEVLHTPGHTPESVSFLLTDTKSNADVPMGIFTGDFLFVGDIGRPDLLEQTANAAGTAELGAKAMFDSIQKISDLPDIIQVWPGHGAGSPCGKSLGAVPISTLGYEKLTNWAFKEKNVKEFINILTNEQPEPPSYFAYMKKVNKAGLPDYEYSTITIDYTEDITNQLYDLRSKEQAKEGTYKGAINIPYNKKFLSHIGWYIDYDHPLTVIVDDSLIDDIKADLKLIGYDQQIYSFSSEKINNLNESYENITAESFLAEVSDEDHILDVRNASEYNSGHLNNAHHIHHGKILEENMPFEKDDKVYIHCQSGVRSAIAATALKKLGFSNVINVQDGYAGIKKVQDTL